MCIYRGFLILDVILNQKNKQHHYFQGFLNETKLNIFNRELRKAIVRQKVWQ